MRILEEKPEIVADKGGVGEFKRMSDGLGDGEQSSPCFRDNVGGVQRKSRKDTMKGAIKVRRSTSQMVAPRCSRVEICKKINRCCRKVSGSKMSNRQGRCSTGGGSKQGEIEMKDEAWAKF